MRDNVSTGSTIEDPVGASWRIYTLYLHVHFLLEIYDEVLDVSGLI